MQRIRQYQTVSASRVTDSEIELLTLQGDFDDGVQGSIDNGWQPYGPAVAVKASGRLFLLQPMVIYEPDTTAASIHELSDAQLAARMREVASELPEAAPCSS